MSLVTITVGRLAGAPGVWVVLDDASLIYAELSTAAGASAYAAASAARLRREGFCVRVDDDNAEAPR